MSAWEGCNGYVKKWMVGYITDRDSLAALPRDYSVSIRTPSGLGKDLSDGNTVWMTPDHADALAADIIAAAQNARLAA